MRRVDAFDVERRIGLGIAQGLRLREHGGEVQALVAHLAEDEIGGAVDDAGHPFDAVGRETLAQRFDDGDADRHRRLVRHRHAMLPRGREDLGAMLRQQRLVGRDHVLACAMAASTQSRAGPVPPATSTTTSTSGWVATCIGSSVNGTLSPTTPAARARLRAATITISIGRPARPAIFGLVAGQHAEGAGAHGADADHAHAQRTHGHGEAVTGAEGTGLDRGTWTSPDKKQKTQLPELGFIRSGGRAIHQVAAGMATCACSGGRGGNAGTYCAPTACGDAGSIMPMPWKAVARAARAGVVYGMKRRSVPEGAGRASSPGRAECCAQTPRGLSARGLHVHRIVRDDAINSVAASA